MKRLHVVWRVIKIAELGPATLIYAFFFLLCSFSVWSSNPTELTFGDGLWYTFQAVTSIGFGDIITESTFVRVCTVLVSVFSLFYVALLTGAFVSYCSERLKAKKKGSLTDISYKLEHLEDLSHDELAELSRAIRKYLDSKK